MQTLAGSCIAQHASLIAGRSAPRHPHQQVKLAARPFLLTRRQVARNARGQAQIVRATETEGALEALPEPEDARGAIAVGLRLFESGDYERALVLFDKALSLPGTGIKRFRDKPPGISDGEKQAAYFNIACCNAKLGKLREGLIAVAGCLEAGYTDFNQLRRDPDLEALRAEPKFEGLMARFERKPAGGPLGKLFEGFL